MLSESEIKQFEELLEKVFEDTLYCWIKTRLEGQSVSLFCQDGNISLGLIKAFDNICEKSEQHRLKKRKGLGRKTMTNQETKNKRLALLKEAFKMVRKNCAGGNCHLLDDLRDCCGNCQAAHTIQTLIEMEEEE